MTQPLPPEPNPQQPQRPQPLAGTTEPLANPLGDAARSLEQLGQEMRELNARLQYVNLMRRLGVKRR